MFSDFLFVYSAMTIVSLIAINVKYHTFKETEQYEETKSMRDTQIQPKIGEGNGMPKKLQRRVDRYSEEGSRATTLLNDIICGNNIYIITEQ